MRKAFWLGVIVCLLATNGFAEDIVVDSEKLDRVRSDMDAVRKRMENISEQQDSLNDQLADIENRYGETAAALRDLKRQVDYKHKRLGEIRRDIGDYRGQISRHGKELSAHIRAAYIIGRQEKLKLILNQQDPALSGRMMVYHSYLNKIRLKQLAEFENAISKLDYLNQEQQQEAELLEIDLEHKGQEQAALESYKAQRNDLLKQLASDFSTNEQQLGHLIESEAKLKNLMASLQNENTDPEPEPEDSGWFFGSGDDSENKPQPSSNESVENPNAAIEDVDFSALKGKLPWPVKGRTVVKAGSGAVESIRDGVLIDAVEGTEIQAVTGGKVVYAAWLRGYGLLMIIDHGQGYMTLYAFNQSLYKRVGDLVRAGDVIASVGQSGGRSRSGLYFGIRKNSKPVDPFEWCPKVDRG